MAKHKINIKELTFEEASFAITELPKTIELKDYEIIGQPRAIKALEMGLNVDRWGYNIFISGDSGTGRLSAVQAVESSLSKDLTNVKDITYVHNFINSDHPKALVLDRGVGRKYKNSLEQFNTKLKENLAKNRDHAIENAISDIETLKNNIKIKEYLTIYP